MNTSIIEKEPPPTCHLVHLPDELVDVVLPITKVASQYVVLELALSPATVGVGELEWPQEVGSLRQRMRKAWGK